MEKAYCDALRIAYEFEKSGEQLYRKHIKQITNEFAKKVLEFLADEEVEHIRKIEEFNDSLFGNGEFDLNKECAAGLSDRIKSLVEERTKQEEEKFAPDSTDLDIYDIAMDMEKRSYEVYEKALEDVKELNDPRLDQFFSFILSEEKEHYELLAASKKYLEDPAYYFLDYGGWIFS